MAKFYSEQDVKMDIIKDKVIAIIGYGSQGHAHALNLRDSGLNVIVGQRPGGENYNKAVADGFEVFSAEVAATKADIIMVLVPDVPAKKIYDEEISKGITTGKMLMFAHGFNILYKQIVPPADVDVAMIAPKGPGHMIRRVFTEGKGAPALVAVEQNATGNAFDIAIAYGAGIGATKAGLLETTFKEETETDLFGEQTVLCGGLVEMIMSGFKTLVDAGYQPEVAYFECLHEVKLIADLVNEGGISYMNYSISDTAEYGEYVVGDKVIGEQSKEAMKQALANIQDGSFAKNWIKEDEEGRPLFNKKRQEVTGSLIESVGKEVRKRMPWLKR